MSNKETSRNRATPFPSKLSVAMATPVQTSASDD